MRRFSFVNGWANASRVLFVGLLILVSGVSAVFGSPVTFRFEAEVTSVLNIGLDAPISPTIGDILRFTYSFEPADGVSNIQPYPQIGQLQIGINSIELIASPYLIVVGNGRPEPVPPAGSIADRLNADDVGLRRFRDDYSIYCDGPLPGSCGQVPGRPDLLWHVYVLFADDTTLFSTSDLLASPASINAASLRQLTLTLYPSINVNGGSLQEYRFLSLEAAIGVVTLVPEPLGAAPLISLVVLIVTAHSTKVRSLSGGETGGNDRPSHREREGDRLNSLAVRL